MVTLAFGQMIFFVFHDTKLGGGTDGAYLGKPLISAFGATLDLPRRQRPLGTYYVALGLFSNSYSGLDIVQMSLESGRLIPVKISPISLVASLVYPLSAIVVLLFCSQSFE